MLEGAPNDQRCLEVHVEEHLRVVSTFGTFTSGYHNVP